MLANWTELILAIIALFNIGLFIKLLSILQQFHTKQIQATGQEVTLLKTQLELQNQNHKQELSIYEQRLKNKDDFIKQIQNYQDLSVKENQSNLITLIREEIMKVLTSKQTIDRVTSSESKDIQDILKSTAEEITDNIKSTGFITVSLGEKLGTELAYPTSLIANFNDLTNKVYFVLRRDIELREKVQPYTYGTTWALRDKNTKNIFRHARMISDLGPGKPMGDNRSLEEVGIKPGTKLEVVMLNNQMESE